MWLILIDANGIILYFACLALMKTLCYPFTVPTSSLLKVHEIRSRYDKPVLQSVIDCPNGVCLLSSEEHRGGGDVREHSS